LLKIKWQSGKKNSGGVLRRGTFIGAEGGLLLCENLIFRIRLIMEKRRREIFIRYAAGLQLGFLKIQFFLLNLVAIFCWLELCYI